MHLLLVAEGSIPEFKGLLETIDSVLKLIFGDKIPHKVSTGIGYVLATALLLLAVWGLLLALSKIAELWPKVLPIFYRADDRRRAEKRRRFAGHIEARLNLLNLRETWQDYRFAELEAEIEAEGKHAGSFSIFGWHRHQQGLRRERSLSAALRKSKERLILVEGEPGSGKSVALRHVATRLAEKAKRSRSRRGLIPLYINLKEMKRRGKDRVDRNLIEAFVLETLKAPNDRDVDEFLDQEFQPSLENGSWLFLFDSFDELPEVLGSSQADKLIQEYAEAIYSFLHGLNQCRGIVASRYFRGPGGLSWPRFRVQPLSPARRVNLVRKVNLDLKEETSFLEWLAAAGEDFQVMTRNPMFLGLLCNHVKTGHTLPETPHTVFESYIHNRFTLDADRIATRFHVRLEDLRRVAEEVAFCMSADEQLGLDPAQTLLEATMARYGFKSGDKLHTILNALEFIKLARTENMATAGGPQTFTFAHRRFQEYFATSFLLKEPERVPMRKLLIDARWRESVVVICQTSAPEILGPLLEDIHVLLAAALATSSDPASEPQDGGPAAPEAGFSWPPHVMHLCSILQDGFAGRMAALPTEIRTLVGALLERAFGHGLHFDRKWALEIAGAAPEAVLRQMIRQAVASNSAWLMDVAYLQASRLQEVPDDVAALIRDKLVRLARNDQLRHEKAATIAHLKRLPNPKRYLRVFRLLEWQPWIDSGLHLVWFAAVCLLSKDNRRIVMPVAACCATLSFASTWWCYGARPKAAFLRVALISRRPRTRLLPSSLLFWSGPVFSIVRLQIGLVYGIFIKVAAGLPAQAACTTVSLYLLWWGSLAIGSARTGRLIRPRWWILLPVVPLVDYVKGLRKIQTVLDSFPILIAPVLGICTGIFLSHWITSHFWIMWVFLGLVLIFSIRILFESGKSALGWIRDWMHDRRLTREQHADTHEHIATREFVEILHRFRTTDARTQFIKGIRTRGKLVPNAETAAVIREEVAGLEGRRDSSTELDELSILLEQMTRKLSSSPTK